MKDQYGRTIDYIRISVTDRCNLRCVYCMPEEGVEQVAHEEILTYQEIVRIAGLCARMGISKVKLTGGEPLVRKGLYSLVRDLKRCEGIEQVTLTTNGVELKARWRNLPKQGWMLSISAWIRWTRACMPLSRAGICLIRHWKDLRKRFGIHRSRSRSTAFL